MVGDWRFHGRGATNRLVDFGEIVVHEMQGHRVSVLLAFRQFLDHSKGGLIHVLAGLALRGRLGGLVYWLCDLLDFVKGSPV
jgi:hypothetical protein